MTAFLSFLLFLISTAQTIIGFSIVHSFSTMMETLEFGSSVMLIAFLLVLEFILAAITAKIRDYHNFFVIFVEIVISPIAVFRYIFGLILFLIFRREYNLKSSNEEALGAVIGYMFYIGLSDESSISRVGNFFTMLLLAFPMAFIMSYAFWINFGLYDFFLQTFGIKLIKIDFFTSIILILFFGGGLSAIRKQPVTVETYNASYKFENRYTNQKKSFYSNDYLSLTNDSIDRGWRKVRGGDEEHITINMILTLMFTPVLAITYLVGLVFSLFSLLIGPVYSCVGSIDYDDVPLSILQRVVHFFFAFVIIPGLTVVHGRRERSPRRSYSGSRSSIDFSSLSGMANLLTYIAAGVGILYFIFAEFSIMEHLSFNCFPNWLFYLSVAYNLTGAVAGLFDGAGFFVILLLVILIVITAILEFLFMILCWILGVVLTLLAFLLQAAYIWIIPLALIPGTVFLYVKTFRETGFINKVFKLLLIVLISFCVIRYGIYTFHAMFPN